MSPTPIKYLPEGKKTILSLITPSIKEGDCYDEWKNVAHKFENGSSQIKGIGFYQYCSTVAHADSFRINIDIAAMCRLTASILDVSNVFQNKNIPINERVCLSPTTYYLDWYERTYPNVTLNLDDGLFFLRFINEIQGTKPSGRQCNRLLNAVVKINKYNRITIDHAIYIKFFSDVTVPYLTFSTNAFLDIINDETYFSELRRVFEKVF